MRRIGLVLIALSMTSCTPPLPGQRHPISGEHVVATGCHSNWPADIVRVNVPGHPFEALASLDGCWVFVSLASSSTHPLIGNRSGGIGVLQWTGSRLALARVVPLSPPQPAGMVLSGDGRLLIVADERFVHFLDVSRMVRGADPLLGSIQDGKAPGSVYAALSGDDRTLFVSDEEMRTVTVIDLQTARRMGFRQSAIIGRIPTGRAPVGLALSRDGRYLFITSEVWPGRSGWPINCRPQLPHLRPVASGAVEIVDVARVHLRPSEAVVGRTPAGCSPVRAVLSPDGARLYVSARGSNAVLAFDARRLVSDPAHALLSTVPVGTAPIGIELVEHGQKIVVANSSRFGGSRGEDLAVLDASKLDAGRGALIATIPAGTFPRELHATPDGQALLLTDYGSDRIELIPIARLSRP